MNFLKEKKIFLLSFGLLIFADFVLGQTFSGLVKNAVSQIISKISYLAFGFAVLFFF
jgi:hypothetical protein